jgi:hypothetical protein
MCRGGIFFLGEIKNPAAWSAGRACGGVRLFALAAPHLFVENRDNPGGFGLSHNLLDTIHHDSHSAVYLRKAFALDNKLFCRHMAIAHGVIGSYNMESFHII